MVKLANRIEALKMSEDDPENPDFPENPTADAAARVGGGSSGEGESSGKTKLSRAMKGAIFREVVKAKVREMKEQEETNKVKEEAEKEASKKTSRN